MSSLGEYEDLIDRLREQEVDDEVVAGLEKFNAGALRQKASKADELAKELEAERAKNKRLVQAPKVEQAFKDAGVDFEQLRPAEVHALASIEFEGDPDPEVISKTISEYALPLVDGTQQQGQQAPPPNAAAVASQARNPGSSARNAGVITPQEVGGTPSPDGSGAMIGGWSQEAIMRLDKEYPEEAEALRRGYEVSLPGFTP